MLSRHALALALVLLAGLGLGGCLLQNLAPTERLSDQVYQLNEEARWGRLDLAVRRVSPRYRPTFMTSRRGWGRRVSVADVEVSAIEISRESDEATSSVELSWYDLRSMTLRSTLLRQRWAKTDEGYLLDEETVVDGDADLLELPEEDAAPELTAAAASTRS